MKKIMLSIVAAAFISAPAMAFEDRLSVGLSYNHGVYAADIKVTKTEQVELIELLM